MLIDKNKRYYVITESLTHVGDPMFFVIEIGSGLVINNKESINKIVTMFAMRPKSVKSKIENNTLLYLKI